MYVGVEVQVILIFPNKVAAICMSFLFLAFLEFIWYFNSSPSLNTRLCVRLSL